MLTRTDLLVWVEVQAEVDAEGDVAAPPTLDAIADALETGGGYDWRTTRRLLDRLPRVRRLLSRRYAQTYNAAVLAYDAAAR